MTEAQTFRKTVAGSEYRPEKPLSAGVWYWRVFSTDATGRQTSGTKTKAFIVDDGTGKERFKRADTTPPVITGVRPFAFNTASGNKPVVKAKWSDHGSIDLSTARLYLDEKDVSSQATISEQGLEFIPEEPLTRGRHTIRIEIRDKAGNSANAVKQQFSVGEAFKTQVELRKDRRIYINDEPFFPVLYYHGLANTTQTEMMDWGWNTKHFMISASDWYLRHYKTQTLSDALEKHCDEVSQFGQMMFVDFMNYYGHDYGAVVELKEILKSLKDHPRIMAYSLDEPNGRPEVHGYAEDFYSTARAVGAHKPVIHLINSPSAAGVFARDGIGDGIVNDNYPYPSQPALIVARACCLRLTRRWL